MNHVFDTPDHLFESRLDSTSEFLNAADAGRPVAFCLTDRAVGLNLRGHPRPDPGCLSHR
jgi:hypothetical protein